MHYHDQEFSPWLHCAVHPGLCRRFVYWIPKGWHNIGMGVNP